MLTTAAPWSSLWLPKDYAQNFGPSAQQSWAGGGRTPFSSVTSYTSMRSRARTWAGTRSTAFTDEDGTTSAYRIRASWLVIRRNSCP